MAVSKRMRLKVDAAEKSLLVELAQALPVVFKEGGGRFACEIDEDAARTIRERCGEQLQTDGFDGEYRLTARGRALESLMDKLFIP